MNPIFDPDTARLLTAQYKYDEPRPLTTILETCRHITRQAAAAQVRRWVKSGFVVETDNARPKTYKLAILERLDKTFALDQFDEHQVWFDQIREVIGRYASESAMGIWDYGATEMLNNAKDHSQGTKVRVQVGVTAAFATMVISDDGEGIFRHITRLCNLLDERFAILELAKGKLTTDPDNHSGEGIFFTSRAFDRFQIQSGELVFDHAKHHDDWLMEVEHPAAGTTVVLRLCHVADKSMRSIFEDYTTPDHDEGLSRFNKTVIPVRLARLGVESVVSRSQAQRLLSRVDKFQSVIFDFEGVPTIGQGFADEIFRVFAKKHPEIKITIQNASDDVRFMIGRVG